MQLVEVLLAHAEYARANEPGTLQYDIQKGAERESGKTVLVVWEMYADKDAETAHFNNPTFAKLIETLGAETLVAAAPSVYVAGSVGGVQNYKA